MTDRHPKRQTITSILITLVLLVILGALGWFYWTISRPAQVAEEGERDRNYLFSIYGFEGDLLRRPSSVAVGPGGDIYVADTGKKRIVVFSSEGDFITTYGEVGEGPTDLWEPLGVAVAPDGRSYVVEKKNKKIVLFDTQKRPIRAITLEEYPLSARVANDLLFVTTESGVVISDLDGNAQTGYIRRGKEPGSFDRPGAVAVGEDGTLYVADSLNYRVQAIGPDGQPKWQYGEPLKQGATTNMTEDTGQVFGLPASIALDDNGYLYVVDGLNSELIILDSRTGERIEKMGDVGKDDGKFYYPDGIDYADGRLVIADKYNDRVQVFRVPTSLTGPDWRPWVPWAALLLALPLLALLLMRRRPQYVMAPSFLERLAGDTAYGAVMARGIKRAVIAESLSEAAAELGDEYSSLDFRSRKTDPEDAAKLSEHFELAGAEAEGLGLAYQLRGKKVLLTDSPVAKAAADELSLVSLTYDEMLESITSKDDSVSVDAEGAGADV